MKRIENNQTFHLPKQLRNENGEIRKVGFELEFAGLTIEKAVDIVTSIFGGASNATDPFHQEIAGARYGDFVVEFDAHFFKKRVYAEYLEKLGVDIDKYVDIETLENHLSEAAALIVPLEVVTPPIPMDELDIVEELRDSLYSNQAKGTKDSFQYAFGLHINPEAPSLESKVLSNYLRAFLLLYEWIMEESDIDLSRRVTPYIDPFPNDYVELVLDPTYHPDETKLITDYLEFNPTRNRPLDFMPIFALINEDLVTSKAKEIELIKKRPAFHYRLPNCLIDQPDWSIAHEWNIWAVVEQFAEDPEKLEAMSKEYLETKKSLLDYFVNKWPQKIKQWLL